MRFESLRQASAALTAYRLRSALGALAIAVAVATIVIVVTALEGVRQYARTTTARTFGADTFVLAQVAGAGRVSRKELRDQLARNPPIGRTDVAFLNRYADGEVWYAPTAQTRAAVIAGALEVEDGLINGTTASLAMIRELDLSAGRFFTAAEDIGGDAVAVIGSDIAASLFPAGGAVGGSVRVAGRRFGVIGVLTRVGSAGGGSVDKYVWIPLRAYERAFGAPRSYQLFVRAADAREPRYAEDRARISLRAKRTLAPSADDNFDVLTPEAARGFIASLSARIGVAAGPISLMALLAAVVVVTNTVLVSVTQRTREIGVRRALGAPRARIVEEVLAESLLLALAGGLFGAGMAAALLAAVEALLAFPLRVEPQTLLWALAAAGASGLLAAWYPARRAVRADVIAALRTE